MEWESFARGIFSGAGMESLALRDHAEDILLATARDMKSAQSPTERSEKSRGHGTDGDGALRLNGASELHAAGRLGAGFNLVDVVSEYRALRASVLRLWRDSKPTHEECDVEELTRFNESIDQSLAKAVSSFTKRVDQARDLYLAILSHDLRNPLNSITMSAALIHRVGGLGVETTERATQISTSASVMGRMIGDLLDYTRTRLGAGMPVSPAPMDLGALCRELYNEFRSAHPDRTFRFEADGDASGAWDVDRLRQAISNVMGNAVQHGAANAPIRLKLSGESSDVVVVVHNGGPPIPPGELPKIFDPLVRGSSDGHPKSNRTGSIGLGLYIAREIANSHGGRIDVTSTEQGGTAFTIRLPRRPIGKSARPILDEQHIRTM